MYHYMKKTFLLLTNYTEESRKWNLIKILVLINFNIDIKKIKTWRVYKFIIPCSAMYSGALGVRLCNPRADNSLTEL